MAIVNGYLTIDEAISYIGRNETRDTYELEDVVTATSRMIDRFCGRHFYQATAEAREFDTRDGYNIELGPFNDLVSATAFAFDNGDTGSYSSTLTASEYQLTAPTQGQAPGTWPYTHVRVLTTSTTLPIAPAASGRTDLIRITGTWGWPSVPIEVKQAARILAAEMAKLQDAPLGFAAGFGDFGVARISRFMPPRAVQLLQPYRHPTNVGLA
jgi:hypothetical protein